MQIETSLRKIRSIVTRPDVFDYIVEEKDRAHYQPRIDDINFKVMGGLVIYRPKGVIVEMFSALSAEDFPQNPIEVVKNQWKKLSEMGFKKVIATVPHGHLRSSVMCRSLGMKKEPETEYNLYTKVIDGYF